MVHPLSLAGGLIFYSILAGTLLGSLVFSWLTYLLILVFLGGVIVLVVYMTTLAANEKLINPRGARRGLVVFLLRVLSLYPLLTLIASAAELPRTKNVVISLFESSNASVYVFRVFYLLLALVCIVKVIKLEKGPLVKRA